MVTHAINKMMTSIFGSRNERLIKAYRRRVEAVNAIEPAMRKLTDAEMKAKALEISGRIKKNEVTEADALPEAFALMRESMDRNIGLRNCFNPEYNFNPEILAPEMRDLYTDVKFKCVGEHDWRFVEIPVALYDALRDIVPQDRPPFRARPFDVQLIGGMVLFEGKIAEMSTGEGKTFVGPLACFMRTLTGNHCHVVTVNDYLVKRDASWVAPAFYALGMSVGYVQAFMDHNTRRQMYQCNVTYGTNSEFGFDYLRDNMKTSVAEQVQGPLDYAIIDEVDSILVDEARTPLIISGPAHDDAPKYKAADEVVRKLIAANKPWERANAEVESIRRRIKGAEGDMKQSKESAKRKSLGSAKGEFEVQLKAAEERLAKEVQMYEVELDRKSAHLTHDGIQRAQEFAGVGSFYIGSNMDWPHLLEQSLRAHAVYERDKDYMVQNDEVVIIDEFTGRAMVGRQWSDGLHQATEAKEGVKIKPETQTMATVTLQNFFKLYKRISGMTGTAMTEADEFMKIYKLDVVKIPTNRQIQRLDQEDLIFMSEKAKWNAIVEQVKNCFEKGQPVLVGTTSVEKSERLSQMLTRKYGIPHEVLNAKNHEREAEIVSMAGQQWADGSGRTIGRVTIATNMAGRGTDIKLGKGIAEAGGLYVLGTERHEARRIDNQLRGRSGRQGDPGESRFYLSLEDDLMKLFAGDFVLKTLQRLGMKEDEAIEHSWVSRSVEKAQKKVEERNFGIRKNLIEYDEVRNVQRNYFYGRRQQILEGINLREMIFEIISDAVQEKVAEYLNPQYVPTVIADWTRQNFGIPAEPGDFYENDYDTLATTIREKAHDEARTAIASSLNELLDADADPQDWDYNALAKWASETFGIDVQVSQLHKMDRDQIRDALADAAFEQIDRKDITPVAKFLEKNFAQQQLADWANNKFGMSVDIKDLVGRSPADVTSVMLDAAHQLYRRREIEYPVEYALEITLGGGGTENIYSSEQLAQWVGGKFGAPITGEQIRQLPLPDLHRTLVGVSEKAHENIEKEIDDAVTRLTDSPSLAGWVSNRFRLPLAPDEFEGETADQRKTRLYEWGHAFLRTELTEVERTVLLQIYDSTWKDHLYAMDQLRESVGLLGYAEKDPRIEYKRRGTGLFQQFTKVISDRVTDIIFKIRTQQNFTARNVYTNAVETFQKQTNTGVGASPAAQEVRAERIAAADEQPAESREEPGVSTIVNDAPRVGRNDDCPCGSGKKYKQCCGKVA